MGIQDELNNIISVINSHEEWSKLEKARYAYIQLGKIVHKDTMFFYTIQNNLLNDEKSVLQYDIDKVDKIINTENLFNYYVVCRTSAEMLKYIYDNCGIECEIRRTIRTENYSRDGKQLDIRHFFLVFTDDENKKYFVWLNPDLPKIQIGSRTSSFGNNIDYIDRDNNNIHFYEGEEIKHTVLTDEQIKELDKAIGFDFNIVYDDKTDTYSEEYTNYFFDLLRKSYLTNNEYLRLLSTTTNEYCDFINLLNNNMDFSNVKSKEYSNKDKEEISLNFKLKDNNFNEVKKFLLLPIINLYSKYDIKPSINIKEAMLDKEYKVILDDFKTNLFKVIDPKSINNMGLINPLKRMKEITRFYETIDKLTNMDINDKEFNKTKRLFIQGVEDISLQFVDEKYLPINKDELSNTYISKKINLAFKQIFDIGNKTDFNNLELSEQIPIVKEILEIILQEVKENKSLILYDESKSPVMNRVFQTILFDKESLKPYYLFYIKNNGINNTNNGNIPIMFDMKENKLITNVSLMDILSKYYVIKDVDLKMIIEEVNNKNEIKK